MKARNPTELALLLKVGERILCIDPGEKNLGIALSDMSRTVANPHSTIIRTKFTDVAANIKKIIENENVGGIIVGLPINMDGSEGPSAQSARSLASNIEAKLLIPTSLWDERLSTSAVTRTLISADTSRKRRSEVVDKVAATYILQGALDLINRST